MWRDIDPRPDERERPVLSRGSGGDQDRHESHSTDPRDVFSRDERKCRGEDKAKPDQRVCFAHIPF